MEIKGSKDAAVENVFANGKDWELYDVSKDIERSRTYPRITPES